jgi:hypothetical protein
MTTFYKNVIDFSNLVKLSLAIEKVLPKNYFSAMEHMHACIKIAGFYFFNDSDEDHRVTQGLWSAEERLKNLTEVLEGLQLEKIYKLFLEPISRELATLLGVGEAVII